MAKGDFCCSTKISSDVLTNEDLMEQVLQYMWKNLKRKLSVKDKKQGVTLVMFFLAN